MTTREEIHDAIELATLTESSEVSDHLAVILNALNDKLAGIEQRQSEYDDLFKIAVHTHVNNQKDDACAKCGLDLWHIVHRRT